MCNHFIIGKSINHNFGMDLAGAGMQNQYAELINIGQQFSALFTHLNH